MVFIDSSQRLEKNSQQIKTKMIVSCRSTEGDIGSMSPRIFFTYDDFQCFFHSLEFATEGIASCMASPHRTLKFDECISNNRRVSCYGM
jgi:hypothetical protein